MPETTAERALLEAVAASVGLRFHAGRLVSAEAGPGGIVTGYALTLADDAGVRSERLVYIETAPPDVHHSGVLRLRDEQGDERAVWFYPDDPRLPALADAVLPRRAAGLLAAVGVPGVPPSVALDVATYRPGKRAVVRVTWPGGVRYLKVVAPGSAQALAERHATWIAHGIPVPAAEGWFPTGVIVLAEQPGAPATEVLPAAEPDRLLDAIDALRARIASVPAEGPARTSLAVRFDWYRRRVTQVVPHAANRLAALDRAVAGLLQPPGPRATIHGDLHLGQLFLDPADPSRLTGVIDIDTAGTGDPADDAAALWAHLVATTAHARDGGETDRADAASVLADRAVARWSTPADPGRAARTAAIAATHLLGHVLTGVLPAEEAIARAEALVAGALEGRT
ncbi:aminoglycoside phosphotransferase family protein [Homoserinibacter sp. GY 40078]|uniref:aminoglycoside phosphotransferase family protein n=1 Tax=Homoserinibacter sp. GY 40078 TaxID=2603275 RepID=UPI00164F87ED|nr:aminoglycoside phosphotransferase family protein [Homoserinibacter sp. GY 40078]